MKSLLSTILAILITFGAASAQSNDYMVLDKSTMSIEGTSTIHDWECNVQEIEADITFDAAALDAGSQGNPVTSLSLTIPVKGIESGKGGMNKKIYGALNEKKYPNITFELNSSDFTPSGTNGNDSHFQLIVNGKLTIAGTTQEVSFPVDGEVQNDGSFKFVGNYEINMKDYDVDPPSAMLGTIKSGEMVTVSYEFYVAKR